MSIYISRSPYRPYSSNSSRRGFKLPSLKGLFSRRKRLSRTVAVQAAARRHSRNSEESLGAMIGSAATAGAKSVVTAKQFFHSVRSKKMNFEVGPGTVMVGLGVLAVVMSLAYLMHFNQVATKGYDLRRLEAERQQLLSQYDIKNMKVAEATSLAHIIGTDKVGKMHRPNEVAFVHGSNAIASR